MSRSDLSQLDPLLSAPKRLAAMAVLRRASSADFGFLRDQLALSDSDLSKQMAALVEAGYVTVTKVGRGRGGTTTYRTTKTGRGVYDRHRAALRAILAEDPDPTRARS